MIKQKKFGLVFEEHLPECKEVEKISIFLTSLFFYTKAKISENPVKEKKMEKSIKKNTQKLK